MAQYCWHCKWYSADGLTNCSTCGATFEAEPEEADEDEEVDARSPVERIGWILALAASALVGGSLLYRRYARSETVEEASAAISQAAESVIALARSFYGWLVGPQGEYKDFVVIAVVATLLVWLALWVIARFGRR